MVDPQAKSWTKSCVQVAPTPSRTATWSDTAKSTTIAPPAHVSIHSRVNSATCQFLDCNIEREFQLKYRRERQQHVVLYMAATLPFAFSIAAFCSVQKVTETSVAFAAMTLPTTLARLPDRRMSWITRDGMAAIFAVFMVLATLCVPLAAYIRKRVAVHRARFDLLQVVVLLFFELLLLPAVLAITACIQLEVSYVRELESVPALAVHQNMLAFASLSLLDVLLFYLALCVATACFVVRLQFPYLLFLVVEVAALAIALTGVHSSYAPAQWSVLCAFVVVLAVFAVGSRDGEMFYRHSFLSSCTLLNENRRLSHQNIEMQEELSEKLSYQLHYEMGDILRVLCQIKCRMSSREKREIDKIITALVTNEDLFEVSFDPSSAANTHEQEVQGWLQMMAFKEIPHNSHRTQSNVSHVDRNRSMNQTNHQVLRSSMSRRMSNQKSGASTNEAPPEAILPLFAKGLAEDRDEQCRWLVKALNTDFFLNVFYLDEHSAAPLQAVLLGCIEINQCIDRLKLDRNVVIEFAGAVDAHYFKRNPYHNPLHAASVVADIHFYLRRLKLNIDDLTFFIGLIAAAGHDISHPGVSNGFLVATKSKLAITYSDDSVLERMHLAELYRLLSHDQYNVFANLDATVRANSRKLIVQMILATDLSRHFQHISKLKSRRFAASEAEGLEVSLIMETLLMLADLGHTAKPFAYHQLWADRISEEFFRQGEAEQRHNLPISPLCDRTQANLPKTQVTFLVLLATPLFETAGEIFAIEEFDDVITELRANIREWQSMIDQTSITSGD